MKRAIILLLAAAMLLSLCACGKKEEEIIGAGIVNPVSEQTADSILEATGISFTPPAGAENVSYQTIAADSTVSQMKFTYEGREYTYRAMPAREYSDISGMLYEWTADDVAGVNGCIAEIRYNSGAQGVITWFDIVPGIVYSLSVEKDASPALLSSMANTVFSPSQGEISGDVALPAVPASLVTGGFTEIVAELQQNYHGGTAGCSLRAAAYAARLLDWCADSDGVTADDLRSAVSSFSASLTGDAAAEFPSQLQDIASAVSQVTSKNGASLLLDCGYSSTRYPWSQQTADLLTSALR